MSLDIRKGDLVKFTNKQNPKVTVTTEMLQAPRSNVTYSAALGYYFEPHAWDVELLERPIDPELLGKATDLYIEERGLARTPDTERGVSAGLREVIQLVNEYHNKENK